MTDARDLALSMVERLVISGILALVAALTLADVVADWTGGVSPVHVGVELIAATAALLGLAWVWAGYLRLRRSLSAAQRSLDGARAEAALWRGRHATLMAGLSRAIDEQLGAWSLTTAEKEVAFLLLKGLSFKEIASVRGAGERTVRQQALAVYAKSGLGGRAELAAFFLEDLLAPQAGTP